MGWLSLCNKGLNSPPHFQEILKKNSNFPYTCSIPWSIGSTQKIPFIFPSSLSSNTSKFTVNCGGDETLSTSSAYSVLGVSPNCSLIDLKAAFKAKVKEFHPDVRRDGKDSDTMIRRVIQAYEILSNYSKSEIIESECSDPFEEPECEAFDLFVNEFVCVGKGCPYSCVNRAPHAFKFVSSTGTARVSSQAEAELLYSLIVKAKFENNRYQKPKKQPKVSTQHVDWF